MKNLLFIRIPSVCICFTLIIIGDAVVSLLWGSGSAFLLVLFGWLIACQVVDLVVSKIEFRKWSHYCVTESVILYLLSRLAAFTVIFLAADVFIFWYFRKRQEIQAKEINELIRAKECRIAAK